MGHTPFGYRIENGTAVIDKPAATKLGRNNKQTQMREIQIPTHFYMKDGVALHDNPVRQAEYLYSLIESESQ